MSCTMNKTMNQHRLATIARVEQVFTELLQECALPEISITDICRQADINRSTFYAIYEDVSALAASFCRSVERKTADIPHSDTEFIWLFKHVAENPDLFHAYFKIGIPPTAEDYKTLYLRNGIYGIVKLWVSNGCIETPEKMNQVVLQILK